MSDLKIFKLMHKIFLNLLKIIEIQSVTFFRCLQLEDLSHLSPKPELLLDRKKLSRIITALDDKIINKYGKTTSQRVRMVNIICFVLQYFKSKLKPLFYFFPNICILKIR